MSDKSIRNLAFGLLGVVTLFLVVATVVEKFCGTEVAMRYIYVAPWMVGLWCLTAVTALVYILRRRRWLSLPALMIHISLLVILAGAGTTLLFGERGRLTLKLGESSSSFQKDNGEKANLPFAIRLDGCGADYYPGTSSPSDYFSEVTVSGKGSGKVSGKGSGAVTGEKVRISMNRVFSCRSYRFYQTALGEDYSVLSISHDPWGIGVSYAGYFLLFLSMVAFFFAKKSGFRSLLKRVAVVALLLLPLDSFSLQAAELETAPMPRTLQRPLARTFGRLYVYSNGRVMPLQTMAREFCLKVYGKDSYRGLTAEQVLTGWIFYYDDWKMQPMIRVKEEKVRRLLGVEGKYARIVDFYDRQGYKLEPVLKSEISDRAWLTADEKATLVSLVCTGAGLKILPHRADSLKGDGGMLEWYSWAEQQPAGISPLLSGEMESVAREIAHGRYNAANTLLIGLRERQREVAGAENLPSETRFGAEILYNRLSHPLPLAVAAILVGGAAFVLFCRRGGSHPEIDAATPKGERWISLLLVGAGWAILVYLTLLIALRWVVSGHIPLSNGFETMQGMAWVALLLALLLRRRLSILFPGGMLVGGFALLVAMMGENNPAVTNLMPVLSSPLLSIHVMLVMTSYALFAMMMMNSVAALAVGKRKPLYSRLADISSLLLYPALFLLTAGIFVGAIWANQSWGRYWGWDPKETWALITMIVYAFPLHTRSFHGGKNGTEKGGVNGTVKGGINGTVKGGITGTVKGGITGKVKGGINLSDPTTRNIYFLAAFLTVLITYFGVNYLLSGLHSYA